MGSDLKGKTNKASLALNKWEWPKNLENGEVDQMNDSDFVSWVFFFLYLPNHLLFIHFLKLRKPKLRKYANTGIDGSTADVKNLDKVTSLK